MKERRHRGSERDEGRRGEEPAKVVEGQGRRSSPGKVTLLEGDGEERVGGLVVRGKTTAVEAADRRAVALYRRGLDGEPVDAHHASVDEALARLGRGEALPVELRRELEPALGVTLGGVRVHTDAAAGAAARAIRAQAFTVGEDIFFAEGAYAPGSREGRKLLVHELSHVVQARQGRLAAHGPGRRVSARDESLEHEAEDAAERFDRRAADPSLFAAPRARAAGTRPPPALRPLLLGASAAHLGLIGPAPAPAPAAPTSAVLARRPDPSAQPLPDTAGGSRLGRTLMTADGWVPELRTLLEQNNLRAITDKAWELLGDYNAPRLGDAFDSVVRRAPSRIDSALSSDAARRTELRGRLFTDLAALGAEQILDGKLDLARLTREADAVGRTYERVAEMYANDRLGTVHPSKGGDAYAFERRGTIFFDLAKQKLAGTARRAAFEGLAADADKIDHGETAAPIGGGQALVAQLLGTDGKDLTGLRDAYVRVLTDVRGGAIDGATAELLRLTYEVHLDTLVLAPIRTAVAGKSGDKLQQVLSWLAREIGAYLAQLDARTAAKQTLDHLKRIGATFVVIYGGGTAVPLPAEVAEQGTRAVAQQQRDAEQRARDAARPRTPAPPPPAPAPHACATYKGYELADIATWLRSYFTDRKAFDAKRLDVHEVQCMRHPGAHGGVPANAAANLAEYRATASRVLGAIAKHVDAARKRDADIAKARAGKASPMPDYVAMFSLDQSFYYLLDKVVGGSELDTGDVETGAMKQSIAHFTKLAHYQGQLLDALKLVAAGKKARTDTYLATKFAESHGRALDKLTAEAKALPGWTGSDKELDRAEALFVQVQEMGVIFDRVEVDRTALRQLEVERTVFARLPPIIEQLWAQRDQAKRESKLEPPEVWKLLEPRLDGVEARDKPFAKELAQSAIDDANEHRLDNLQKGAAVALMKTDTLNAELHARRAQELARQLGQPVSGDPSTDAMAKLQQYAAGESQNLVMMFTMGEAALTGTAGNWGDIMRAANILKIAMSRGAATLTTALEVFPDSISQMGFAEEIAQAAHATKGMGPVAKTFFDGTSKELFHSLQTSKLGVRGSVGHAFEVLEQSKKTGALKMLLAVEAAGGGMPRKIALAALADRINHKGGAQGYATAKFIYAFCLEALQVLDKSVAEQSDKAAGKTSHPLELTQRRKSAVEKLDAHQHPITDRKLLPVEQGWWKKYKAITGEDNIILPGKEGWAEIGDFVKQLVAMLVLAWISGGLAAGAAEVFALGRFGAFLVEAGLFTQGMRFADEIKSGRTSEHSFAHDFLLNVVMMGATKVVQGGFAKMFKPGMGFGTKMFLKAGEFAAEYAAVSAISLVDLAITKGITNVTAEDVSAALKSNFAFIAAFKGVAVLGAGATFGMDKMFGEKPTPAQTKLIADLKVLDKQINKQMEATAKAKDSRAQIEAVEKQVALTEQKAKLLENSNVPGAQQLAAQYRKAIDLFRADVARAEVMSSVGVKPVEGTPDFTYEGGPGAEARLAEHFVRAGQQVRIEEGASGKVFEVITGGGRVRFTPIEALTEGAGSAAEAYTSRGRIEKSVLKTGTEVMSVLNGSSARHGNIPKNAGPQFLLAGTDPSVVAQVTIRPVDHHTIKSTHGLGPAAMKIEYVGGGRFEITIEVRRNTSNDQVVRSVNHELSELGRFLDRAVEVGKDSGKGLDHFKTKKNLDALLRQESGASATKKAGKQGEPSSHDLGVIEGDVYTLGRQLEEIVRKRGQAGLTKAERAELEQRLDLLERDLQKVWKMLGLPLDKVALDKRLQVFKDAGIELSKEAVSQLHTMRAARGEAADVVPKISETDIHICFVQLKIANPKVLESSTYLDLMSYYHDRIEAKANEAVREEFKRTKDREMALAAGMAMIRELAGGTSLESWRGRAFEGLSIEEWNADPARVADRGRMYQVTLNNFKTYDAVCVKGAEVGNVEVNSSGRMTITNGKGEVIYREAAGKKPTIAAGVEVWKVSMKAKDTAGTSTKRGEVGEMQKAIGTPAKPTGHGMLVTAEYMKNLNAKIAEAKKAVSGATTKRERTKAEKNLELLEFFKKNIEVSKQWSNAKIDALLETLKREGVDISGLESAVIDRV